MLAIVATLVVKEGKEAEFEAVMKELMAQTRANEPGCKLYALHRAKAPRTYVMFERYDGKDSLAAHSQSAHFRGSMGKMLALLDGAPKIEMLDEVA
jgi:quinol monooxygenase YgiN